MFGVHRCLDIVADDAAAPARCCHRARIRIGERDLLVGRFKFLRKWYPFLPDPVFDAMFQKPVQQLEQLLLLEGTLVFEANHTRVYRLASDKP